MTRRVKSIRNKYFCLRCFDQNWLIECECGCGEILSRYDKFYMKRSFIKGHSNRLKDFSKYRKGINHHNYKFGRYKNQKGYWILTGMFEYINADIRGRIREHIYFYQEYHKCCMLKWGVVHHIDENKENNMPWNLMGMMRSNHMSLHKSKK